MEWFNILRTRLRALWQRESVLQDIEEELRVHIEMETERNLERGLSPDEARAAALKSFGKLSRKTELSYDVRGSASTDIYSAAQIALRKKRQRSLQGRKSV